MEKEEKIFDKKFYIYIGVFGLLVAVILTFPFLLTRTFIFHDIDFSNTGQVGDTIGGTTAPFIGIAASFLTFIAFWVQYKANIQQKNQFKESIERQDEINKEQKRQFEESITEQITERIRQIEQYKASLEQQEIDRKENERISRIERFETKFYELLKFHRANIDEMNIEDKVRGRKCFVYMFFELKYIYNTVNSIYNKTPLNVKTENYYDAINVLNISYHIFFFGIGFSSEKFFIKDFTIGEKHLYKQVKGTLMDIQKRIKNPVKKISKPLPNSIMELKKEEEFIYIPFEGHSDVLGHYFRHLFQTAKYITQQDKSFLNKDQKYEYVKTLRAQLSNFEQLLLYYNSLAWFNDEWKEIFTVYKLIKNLPISLADFHIKPDEYFKDEIRDMMKRGESMFEWYE